MADEQGQTTAGEPLGAGWQIALDELERSLRQAVQAISTLRGALSAAPPPAAAEPTALTTQPPAVAGPVASPAPAADAVEAPASAQDADQRARSTFERLWERIEHERRERDTQPADEGPARRGLDLLPQDYLMTVEDREGKVDLIALHRALLGLVPVENIALLSFANGVPVISMRSDRAIDLDRLGAALSDVMDRECEVIPQDNGRVYLRLRTRSGSEEA